MKFIRSVAIFAVSLLVLLQPVTSSIARANDAELARVLKALETLEARVATLESENQRYRRDAASTRIEAQAPRQKLQRQTQQALARQSNSGIPVRLPPSGSYAMATKAPLPAVAPTWGGFYAGASFGVASQRANRDATNPSGFSSTQVSGPFTQTIVNTELFASNLSGRGPGAMIDLYLGYNHMLTDNILLGAQLEGGVSNMRTGLAGPFSDSLQSRITNSQAGVVNVNIADSTLNIGNTTDHLDNRWTMSALLRGGLLADSKDLIYLIGGLSYARFEYADQAFGAFGGTVGAGWERKIAPTWTLKAEYRYTQFQDRTVTTNLATAGARTITSVPATPPSTVSSSSTSLDSSKFSGLNWQTVMVGVSHYFDAN